jgi:hypothetical protein
VSAPQPPAKTIPGLQGEDALAPPASIPASPVTIHPSALAAALKAITRYADDDAAAVAAIVTWEDIEIIERIVQAVKKAKAAAGDNLIEDRRE